MKRPLLKVIWPIFAIGLLGIMPFILSSRLNDPVRYPQLLALAGTQLLVIILALLGQGRKALRPLALPRATWILLVSWLALHFLALSQAINLAEGLFETIQSSLLVCVFLLASHFLQTAKTPWRLLSQVLVIGSGFQALLALLQWSGTDLIHLGPAGPPSGTHANPNQLAAALILSLPLLLWAAMRLSIRWKIAAGISTLLTLTALFATGSRTSWLILFAWAGMLPFYLIFKFWKEKQQHKQLWSLLAVCMIVLVGIFFLAREVNGKKRGSYNYSYLWDADAQISPHHNSLEYRFVLWNRSMDMVGEYPILGVGPGNWKVVIPKYGIKGFDKAGRYGLAYSLRAHNEFLQVAGEMGLGGLFCFLFILGGLTFLLIKTIIKTQNRELRSEGFLLLLGIVAIILLSFFSFPRERPFSGMMIALLSALSLDLGRRAQQSHPRAGSSIPLAYFLLFCSIAALAVIGMRAKTDAEIHQLRAAKAEKNWPLVLQIAQTAHHPMLTIDPVAAAPVQWYAGIAHLSAGQNAAGLAAMQAAAKVSPYHLAVRTNLAAAFELNGQHQQAAKTYQALLNIFPDFEAAWLNLAIVYLHLNDFAKVRSCLGHVSRDSKDPNYHAIWTELERLAQ